VRNLIDWIRKLSLGFNIIGGTALILTMLIVLLEILTRLWLRMGPLIAGYYERAQQDMVQRHHGVVAAFEARDPEEARAQIRADIDEGRDGITRYIASFAAPKGQEFGQTAEPSG
jgi:hypothetical protein